MSHSRTAIVLFSLLVIIFLSGQTSTVHAALSYNLAFSTSRVLEVNSPGVTMTLNVTNTTPGQILGFSWNVTDPSGSLGSFFSAAAANGPALSLTTVYPRDFSGASVKYNGTYRVNIFQTYPGPTALVAIGKFYAGLTDSLVYQRTTKVSILAQGYASTENITIRMSHGGVLAPGFPRFQLASTNGVLSYLWPIPSTTPLGDLNVSLSGQATVKKPPDSQIFTILPTSVSISQLAINLTQFQGSQIAIFSFTAVYPDGSQVNTGTTTIRVVEPNGITIHPVSALYNTTINVFQGTYPIASSAPPGGWATIIDVNSFSDGYGNVGPSAGIVRGFVVESASSNQTSTATYLLLIGVLLAAAALAILLSWIVFFGRKRVQRSVLKVDFQSIEREAARVENREFFTKVHDQLEQRKKMKPEEEAKDG